MCPNTPKFIIIIMILNDYCLSQLISNIDKGNTTINRPNRLIAHPYSGATCHMYKDKNLFVDLRHLSTPQQVTLGDGSHEGPAEGTVKLDSILPCGSTQKCRYLNVAEKSNEMLWH